MNVVARLLPFQRTTEVLTKPLPSTVNVKAELPAAWLAGDRLVTTGTGEPCNPAVLNVAVTVVAALTVTTQVPVPLQAPPQPAKVEPDADVALRLYWVPARPDCVQSLPHEIPAGKLDTVPEPVPLLVTVSVTFEGLVVEPLTAREIVSPPAVKLTLPAKLPVVVGWKRTVTSRLAPPTSEKVPPETMLNGEPTLTATAMLAEPGFCTVKTRSTVLLTATLPKVVVPVGVTVKSGCATPLAEFEHPLSLPALSTAVTRTKYVVPAVSDAMRVDIV
jgi:hypothetical protein